MIKTVKLTKNISAEFRPISIQPILPVFIMYPPITGHQFLSGAQDRCNHRLAVKNRTDWPLKKTLVVTFINILVYG